MSSQVNPSAVNANYPVPGVNQSTQGFRSNFLAIQNNFTQYVLEMNDLINKVIVSAPLTYGANTTFNNFGGMYNSNLALLDFALVTGNIVAASANTIPTLNFSNTSVANIQITASSPTMQTINIVNFPGLGYSEQKLIVQTSTPPHYLNLSSIVPGGTANVSGNSAISGFNSSTGNFAITTTNPYHITLGSADGQNWNISSDGTAVARISPPATSVGAAGDTAGMIAYGPGYVYVCTENFNGSSAIWQRAALSTF